MKRMKKAGLVATSVATIAVCSSLIVGSTYALFTSEDKVDISVTAGKVSVTAEIVESSLALTSMGVAQEGNNWANGGSAGFSDKKNLDLTYITPGDSATFDIKVTNESNVNIQYRLNWSVDGELAGALEATATGAKIGYWTEWLASDEVKEKTVSVTVALPEGAGNEYQNKSASISFAIEAVQGNASVWDYEVSDTEGLKSALEEGGIVSLKNDIALTEIIQAKGDITIIGNGNSLIVPQNNDRVINVDGLTEPITINLSGVDIVGPTSGTYTRGLSVYNCKDVKIVMDNCSMSCNYYALNIASSNENVEVIVKNSTLTGWAASQTHSANSKITFENCTLEGINDKSYNADGWNNFATFIINTTAGNSEISFKNCTIKSASLNGNAQYFISIRTDSTVNYENCTFVYNDETLTDSEEVLSLIQVYGGCTIDLTVNGEIIEIE